MDIEKLSAKHKLEELGLKAWDENGLMLLPEKLLKFIPDNMIMTSINKHRRYKKQIDTDTRGGILAYGFIEDQYEKIASLLMRKAKNE
jgi:hypothetical protein